MHKNKKTSAFSLLEMSIIMVIIGVISGIVVSSSYIFNSSKLSTAQILTQNSPLNNTKGVVLWLETSLNKSFNEGENVEGGKITIWKNNHLSKLETDVSQGTVGFQPTYKEEGINGLPAISFTASADQHLLSTANDHLSEKGDFNIFVVFKADITSSDDYSRIWEWCGESVACGLTIKLGDPGQKDQLVCQLTDGVNRFITNNNTITSNRAYIVNSSFYGGGATDNDKYKLFLNNIEQSVTVTGGPFGSVTATDNKTIKIGGHNNTLNFDGEIGEIIVINQAISEKRRQEIYDYLAKKWGIK